jgi:hypothetical protein
MGNDYDPGPEVWLTLFFCDRTSPFFFCPGASSIRSPKISGVDFDCQKRGRTQRYPLLIGVGDLMEQESGR